MPRRVTLVPGVHGLRGARASSCTARLAPRPAIWRSSSVASVDFSLRRRGPGGRLAGALALVDDGRTAVGPTAHLAQRRAWPSSAARLRARRAGGSAGSDTGCRCGSDCDRRCSAMCACSRSRAAGRDRHRSRASGRPRPPVRGGAGVAGLLQRLRRAPAPTVPPDDRVRRSRVNPDAHPTGLPPQRPPVGRPARRTSVRAGLVRDAELLPERRAGRTARAWRRSSARARAARLVRVACRCFPRRSGRPRSACRRATGARPTFSFRLLGACRVRRPGVPCAADLPLLVLSLEGVTLPVARNATVNTMTPASTGGRHLRKNRRRPTLPGGLPPSTIGAGGLNCRVRNGNGCVPAAMATGSSVSLGLSPRTP